MRPPAADSDETKAVDTTNQKEANKETFHRNRKEDEATLNHSSPSNKEAGKSKKKKKIKTESFGNKFERLAAEAVALIRGGYLMLPNLLTNLLLALGASAFGRKVKVRDYSNEERNEEKSAELQALIEKVEKVEKIAGDLKASTKVGVDNVEQLGALTEKVADVQQHGLPPKAQGQVRPEVFTLPLEEESAYKQQLHAMTKAVAHTPGGP